MKHINQIIFIFSLFIPCFSHAMLQLPPLHRAAHYGNFKQLQELLISARIINGRTEGINTHDKLYGWTPLHWAAEAGHTNIVALLLDHGAEVNAVTLKADCIPMHLATQNGHTDAAKLLLDKGANINHRDRNGLTPLHMALISHHEPLLSMLRTRGVNVDIGDRESFDAELKWITAKLIGELVANL
jgi:ankyrin repeat protein